jgi:hypothetical protein
VIYLDTPNGGVSAVDGATGATKWKWQPTMADSGFTPDRTRRGVSVGQGKVYTLASGGRIVALNKDTGAQVWVVQPTGPGGASLGNIAKVATRDHDGMVLHRHQRRQPQRRLRRQQQRRQHRLVVLRRRRARPRRHRRQRRDHRRRRHLGAVAGERSELCADGWGVPLGPSFGGSRNKDGLFHLRQRAQLRVVAGRVHASGDNLFGDSLVAVDYKTGDYKWHFQSIRHDHWDMDNTHAPVLADVMVGGQVRKAIYYGSKPAMTFVLDRTNGQSLLGLVEKPRPQDSRQNSTATQKFPAQGMWFPECVVWEPLGTRQHPGNPWRGVPNYNGYQPNASGSWCTPSPTTSTPTSRS